MGHANLLGRNLYNYIMALGKRLTILHIHDNDGNGDLHMMPYTQVRYRGKCALSIDWEGMIAGLRDIGYDGTLAFETFRTLEILPRELWNSGLRSIADIGHYFKARIEAPETAE